uniref:Uncharacterized protein n=1 Tax=Lotharella globosa TaxID=91324 RepID=A0A7S3Z807_9EUKA
MPKGPSTKRKARGRPPAKDWKPPKPCNMLPSSVEGVYRLSHREIIDDVADLEHQISSFRNYPVSETFRKKCIAKGIDVEAVMEAARCPEAKLNDKPGELEALHLELINLRATKAKLDREIAAQKAEYKALKDQRDQLRDKYTKSVRNSETNRVQYQKSVLGLREQLWRETSLTAETSGKLEELRMTKQDIMTCDNRYHQYHVEMESAQMQIDLLKEIAQKSGGGLGVKEYPVLVENFASQQRSQFDKIKYDLKVSQSETATVSKKLESATVKVTNLKFQLEEYTKKHNEMTTQDKMRAKQVDKLVEQENKLKEQKEGLLANRAEQENRISEAKGNNLSKREVVALAERRVKETEAALRETMAELKQIKAQVVKDQKTCTKLWKEAVAKKAECEKGSERLRVLNAKVDGYISRSKTTLSKAQKRHRQLEGEEGRLSQRLKVASTNAETAASKLKEIVADLKATQSLIEKNKASLDEQLSTNSALR